MIRNFLITIVFGLLMFSVSVNAFAEGDHEHEHENGDDHGVSVESIQVYVCPMHLTQMSKNPDAECPECGMKMLDINEVGPLYYCPMFCDGLLFTSETERCPICNMKLKVLEEVLICTHCGDKVYLDYNAKCEICDMELTPVLIAVPDATASDDTVHPDDHGGHHDDGHNDGEKSGEDDCC